jgi:hypothetical protein
MMSGVPNIDPNLDALRGRAIALKVNGARILELIDEAIAAGSGDVSGATRYLKASIVRAGDYDTAKYNLLGDSLRTVMAAASEAVDLLESHGTTDARA